MTAPAPPAVPPARSPRESAARILAAWMERGDFPDRMLDEVSDGRAFVMEAVYGVVRRYAVLDWIVMERVAQRPRPEVLAALFVGIYQLLFMESVEAYAAVNETVEAVKRHAGDRAASFVNALLRRVQRERGAILAAIPRLRADIRLSHPPELFYRWRDAFGEPAAVRLCEWDNERADVCLRVNAARVALPKFLATLHAAGIQAEPHPFDPARFVRLARGARLPEMPGFREGWFYAQDPATAVAPLLLAPQPGERVLDACASPGGKTMILAEQLQGRGLLVAMDLHDDRLGRLAENLARMGHPEVCIVPGDARSVTRRMLAAAAPAAAEGFDRILLDVPCSNTGVIRRRPDARWAFGAERLQTLRLLQFRMLGNAARLLAPGGRIVYSTCSLEADENEQQVRGWLAQHPEFRLLGERRLFPPETATDGAYAALLGPAP